MRARRPTLVVGLLLIASLGSEGRADAQRAPADVTQACVDAHVSAQRLRRDRHLREARDALIACSRDACPRVLVEECGPWLRDVDQAIPAVIIEAHAPDGSDAARVHVFVDGVSFADRLDGKAIEIDPGEHVFRYELAGSPPASETIVIREGEKSRRLSVHFAAPPGPIARSPEIPAPLRPVPAATYGLGALGVVGLAAFATFGAIGVAKKSDLEAEDCKPNCTDVAPARRAFLAGDISLAVGVAALAGATALYLTRPSVKTRASTHLHLGAVPALRPMLTVEAISEMADRRSSLLWSTFASSCLVALPACTFVENLNQFDEGTSSSSGENPACGPFEHPGTSSIADDFNAATLDAAKWFSVGDCATQTQGEIQVTPLADAVTDYCWIGTNATLHLACDSVTLKVPGTTAPIAGPQTFLYIEQANAPQFALILEGGGFLFSGADGLAVPGDRDYDSVADLWWRLRESAGILSFDTAPDGLAWTTRIQIPDPNPLDDVRIDLGAGTHEAVATPGQAHFDCYDVPPPCP